MKRILNRDPGGDKVGIARSIFWWMLTLAVLFIVDDLLFGPCFWLLSLADPLIATMVAFCSSFLFQVWLVQVGTRPDSGVFGRVMLRRLMLGHRKPEINYRELALQKRAASLVGAIAVTPIIGGVIPALILHRHGVMGSRGIRIASIVLAAIYAGEFAALHGGYGFGALLRAVL